MGDELILTGKLIIFDKDGCLVRSVIDDRTGKTHAPNRLDEQSFFPDVAHKCAQLIQDGNTLAVASNQGGVAFGIFSPEVAESLVESAAAYIGAKAYRVCFHHPKGKIFPFDTDHANRKPSPGMLLELMTELGFKPDQTVMVGDWESDLQAAEAAECEFRWAHEFFERANVFGERLHNAEAVARKAGAQ